MSTHKEKLEKVEYLNNKNLEMIRESHTGQVIVHWQEGEPKLIEIYQKKKIEIS